MRFLIAGLIFAFATCVMAQQPPQGQMPSQMALQIDNVINSWAQTLEAQQRELVELRGQLTAAQARVKALQDKYEPKK